MLSFSGFVTHPITWSVLAALAVISCVVGIWGVVLARRSATKKDIEHLKQDVLEYFNHKFAVAPDSTATLARRLPADRIELLRKAADAQRAAKYVAAIEYLRQCDYPGISAGERATLHVLVGNSYMYLSELREAEREYADAIELAQRAGDQGGEAAALGNLGIVRYRRGDLGKAEEHHKGALRVNREIGDRLGEANCLGNLGNVYRDRGELDKAEEHYENALAIAREIGDPLAEATGLGNLGIVYGQQGQFDRAEQQLKEALELASEISDCLLEGTLPG